MAKNIPLSVGLHVELWNKIMKEVRLGRYAGPFEEHNLPFKYYIQSPIGLVAKAGNQTRLIFHLSFDFGRKWEDRSVNFHTPENLCSVKYHDLDYAVQSCLRLKVKLELVEGGIPHDMIFMGKSDLKSAFRILPILVRQRRFLFMKAFHPVTGKAYLFVEKNLSFGVSCSCKVFQDFSDCLHHILESMEGCHFQITNYLDDFYFVAESQVRCNFLMQSFLNLCEDIGVPVALDKTEWATQTLVFLGVLLDSKSFTLAIPQDKKNKALKLLNWVIQQRSVTIKIIQRLTGTLNFLSKVIMPGWTFTRMMYKKLTLCDKSGFPLKQYHHISVDKSFKQDCQIWRGFLQEVTPHQLDLCRPFVNLDVKTHATMLNFYTDASLNENFGIGGIFGNMFFVGR